MIVINDSSILNNYGVVLANLNKIEEAKKYFKKALKINFEDKMAKDNFDNLNSSNIKRLHIESSNEDLLKTVMLDID